MSYKFIFSQMFDVRPRKETGDLDWEKIKKIEAILNLKTEQTTKQTTRIINLKSQARYLAVLEEPIKQKLEGENKKEIVAVLEDATTEKIYQSKGKPRSLKTAESLDTGFCGAEPPIVPLSRAGARVRNNFQEELLEETIPDRSDILSIFEAIESAEQLLKTPLEFNEAGEESVEIKEFDQLKTNDKPDIFDKPGYLEPPEDILLDKDGRLANEQSSSVAAIQNLDQENIFYPDPEAVYGFKSLTLEAAPAFNKRKALAAFLITAFLIFSLVPVLSWLNRVWTAKAEILNSSLMAYEALISAKKSLEQFHFSQAQKDFATANQLFSTANSQLNQVGSWLVFILENLPGFSFFSSRTHLIKAGQDLSQAGQDFMQLVNLFGQSKIIPHLDSLSQADSKTVNLSVAKQDSVPFLAWWQDGRDYLYAGLGSLISANQHLQEVKMAVLPREVQGQLVAVKEKLPQVIQAAGGVLDWADRFLEIFGANRQKKYLLIFQNNAEARATGGFIGTYGILDLDQGQITNLFIDNVFNADGQLKEKVIPPKPIQKISTAWSMHDSNWFADFSASAQKVMWFYEKTGGPTVDGVISFTPTVIERLLVLTGPIELPEYGVTLNQDNFAEITQYKVEVDYDKELNQPKKILADFAPKFLDKISQVLKDNNLEVLKIINQCLKEKHILIYFSDEKLQQFVRQQGWSGEVMPSDKDYFSVVHTNINGFKTDQVIEEKIRYFSQIEKDGSLVDTLEISRHHKGGALPYDWYNRVNADYLRVYLPKGSQLLSVSGQTLEVYQPPIDYQAAGFRPDPEVLAQEQSASVDEQSGTQIFEESGKTVFANWVFVSPGETVTLTYQYRLPFKLDVLKENTSFALLAQKQSGTIGSSFFGEIKLPQNWQILSAAPDFLKREGNSLKWETDLSVDRILEFTVKSN